MNDQTLKSCSLNFFKGARSRCRWCNKRLVGRQRRWCSEACANEAYINHIWGFAREQVMKRDAGTCVMCGAAAQEVDHIRPCLGRHSQNGCWHHQDNLRALCKPCHKRVTDEQRRAGLFKKGRR